MDTILPTKEYGIAEEIENWIKKEKDRKFANRLNAIRLLMLDYQKKEVGKICGVNRRSVRRWVKKWNAAGKEGLVSKSGGSASNVTESIRADITEIIDVKKKIDGRIVTGKLICGYLKKITH